MNNKEQQGRFTGNRARSNILEAKRLELEFEQLKLDCQKARIELLLKRKELNASKNERWKDWLASPLTLAIVGGFITLMTTTITSRLSSSQSIDAEAAKAKQALQTDLIKRFVDNPNPAKVRANLQFLVDVNLVPSYAESIQDYLKKTPDSGLPSAFNSAGIALQEVHTDDDAIDLVMRFEGGFFSAGGNTKLATKFGITLDILEKYLGRKVSIDNLRDLSIETARDIYRKLYLIGNVSDITSVQVKAAFLGLATSMGTGNAIRFFRTAIGKVDGLPISEDGSLSEDVLKRINSADPDVLIETANCEAVKRYKRSPFFDKFGRGWIRRLRTFSPIALNGICSELQETVVTGSKAQLKP